MKHFLLLICLLFQYNLLKSQTDDVPPVITCSAPAILNVIGGVFTIFPAEFIDTVYDNQTAAADIELGIRKSCTGEGFPENSPNVILNWENQVRLEIWARDEAGNTAMCMVQSDVIYFGDVARLEYRILGTTGFETEGNFTIEGYSCLGDTFSYQLLGVDAPGNNEYLHVGDDFKVKPFNDSNPLNGVTTYDLVLIQQHILNVQPLDSPYKILAADVNLDGKVTLMDLIWIRRLILGIDNQFPSNKSWRFVPVDYVFPNPMDPFLEPVPDSIRVDHTQDALDLSPFTFRAIKLGDVNNSAILNQ